MNARSLPPCGFAGCLLSASHGLLAKVFVILFYGIWNGYVHASRAACMHACSSCHYLYFGGNTSPPTSIYVPAAIIIRLNATLNGSTTNHKRQLTRGHSLLLYGYTELHGYTEP
jgi:hypothetical protein